MSKLTIALVTLLGTSSAAMASPSVSFSAHANFAFGTSAPTAPVVRDHRDDRNDHNDREQAYPMPANQWTSWISLGAPMSFADGRDVLRPEMNLDITQVRLQATSGMSYVQKVTVRFRDGSKQSVMLNTWLTMRSPMLQFDLSANHRGIDSITVLGTTSGRNASYQVFAEGGRIEQPHHMRPSLTGKFDSVYGFVYLTQTGDQIHGTYPGKHGTIDGHVEDGVATFHWAQPDSQGMGTFAVGPDGRVQGTWGTGRSLSNSGEWDLTRTR
jgi:hypothetical protein